MNDLEKIAFLVKLLRTEKFEMDLERASALVQSYRWLLDQHRKEVEKNSVVKLEEPIKKDD